MSQEVSCPHCGHSELAAPDIDLLDQAVAGAIIAKAHRRRPQENRFLRKYLGLSAVSLASHVGATPGSVSRWENGRTPIGITTDRLLRLMVGVSGARSIRRKPSAPLRASNRNRRRSTFVAARNGGRRRRAMASRPERGTSVGRYAEP